MNLEDLLALSGIALALTCGPGPNNAMLSASGANYGWRLSVPHAMGVTVGFPLLIIALAVGLERVVGAFPRIVEVLSWVGFAMILWYAWRIATAGGTKEQVKDRPLTFMQAVAFQWVNPKAWALSVYITATYTVSESAGMNTLLVAVVFLVSGFASSHAWVVFGAGIGKWLTRGWRLRTFDTVMALTLVASAIWMTLDR